MSEDKNDFEKKIILVIIFAILTVLAMDRLGEHFESAKSESEAIDNRIDCRNLGGRIIRNMGDEFCLYKGKKFEVKK